MRQHSADSGYLGASKIARKLVLWAVVAGSIASLVLSSIQFLFDYNLRHEQVETSIQEVGETFLPSLGKSIWAFDLPQVKLQMEAFIQQPYITSARLLLNDGSEPQQFGNTPASANQISKTFSISHTNRRGEINHLGQLILTKDFKEEQIKLLDQGLHGLISNTIIIAVIAFSIVLIFQVTVTRRLVQMASQWRNISAEDLRDEAFYHQLQSQTVTERDLDELDELKRAIEVLFRTGHRALCDADDKEKKLVELKKKADTANTAKSDFLANMSHEIRTPMNGVMGISELLLKTELTHNQTVLARQLRSSAENLLQIINDILDFSKIEAGLLEISRESCNIDDLLTDIAYNFSPLAVQKQVHFICPASPPLNLWVEADSVRIKQILINLVSNALKFTQHGEVAVSYQQVDADDQRVRVRFVVTDTGPGVPQEQQHRLFDRFTQADSSATRRFGGTGLGLAICKQLVSLMDGEIGFASSTQGSEFWFEIPFKRVAHDQTEGLAEKCREKLLIIDENSTNGSYLRKTLNCWGVDNEVVADSAQVVQRLLAAQQSGAPFTMVLLDHQPQAGDGFGLIEAVRRQAGLESPLFVVMTYNLLFDIEKYPAVDRVLVKPIQQQDLYHLLFGTGAQVGAGDEGVKGVVDARVLVVEDNPTNKLVAESMLCQLGVGFDSAENGREALAKLAVHRYDLVLMDCQMPVLDGYHATEMIRQGEENVLDPDVPVVAMTANALIGDREKCLAAGMNDYISKPVTLAKLSAALNRWLSTPTAMERPETEITAGAPRSEPQSQGDAGAEPREERIFDLHQMQSLLMHDNELIVKVIDTFLNDLPPVISQLKAAAARRQMTEVASVAHRIKGAADNVGGNALRACAWTLEQAARAQNGPRVDELVPQLERSFEQLEGALRQKLKEIKV